MVGSGGTELLREARRRIDAALTVAPAAEAAESWHGMIGACPALRALRRQAEKFAKASAPVLIRGESGTGKEVLARILHDISPRAKQPFVSENCAAIPHSLLESVLFGHKMGSFTGAVRDHDGHFVAADKGTLFLDEIGDMPLPMQAKLLRVLQEGEVRPVGGTKIRKVDVRILAATNQDLEQMVSAGRFREDLYYRLNVLRLDLPPLRDRGDDVLLLARTFLAAAASAAQRELTLSAEAAEALQRARWPGNVRQLYNEMQRVSVLASGPVVEIADLSSEIRGR
ncbi:MAG: sigma-54-dependent Fis family transcriptional regulator [Planctomycetes bacterium]|nr:sigma-54-dependent Fis family transcriptional regulator [Planctomycetota bacterium]MCB9870381.1 sigma-54-dependent Fis family transcriptional regulator [Planctomycetota bacterium]